MGITSVTFGTRDPAGVVHRGLPRVSESLDGSAASAATTGAARLGEVARIACQNAAWVTVGTSPTASVGTTWYIPAGGVLDLEMAAGHKVAVLEA
jgi:hypothetical protein